MSESYDDLFESVEPSPKMELPPYDNEAYKAKKQQEREETYALLYGTSEKMQQDAVLFQSYLDVQARFDRYSANNAVLITAQRPDATRLAEFDTWKEEGVYVNKGEKALSILEPGGTFTKEDGTQATAYNVKKMFDVTQTNSQSKPPAALNHDNRKLLIAHLSNAPCKLSISEGMSERINAIYRPEEKTILVRAGMDAEDIFRAVTQELAHAHLDQKQSDYDRKDAMLVAYFSSYVLCKRFDISTDIYHFEEMPARYRAMNPQEFRKELSKIREVSNTISHSMNRVLSEQQKQIQDRGGEAR